MTYLMINASFFFRYQRKLIKISLCNFDKSSRSPVKKKKLMKKLPSYNYWEWQEGKAGENRICKLHKKKCLLCWSWNTVRNVLAMRTKLLLSFTPTHTFYLLFSFCKENHLISIITCDRIQFQIWWKVWMLASIRYYCPN